MKCFLFALLALMLFVVGAVNAAEFTWGEPVESSSEATQFVDTVGNWSEPWPVEPAPVKKKLAFAEWYDPAAQISFQEKMNRQSLIGNRSIERTRTVTVPAATQLGGWGGSQASGCSGASSYSRSVIRRGRFRIVGRAGGG